MGHGRLAILVPVTLLARAGVASAEATANDDSLRPFSNLTLSLRDDVAGDELEQSGDRLMYVEADVALAERLHLVPSLRVDRMSWAARDFEPAIVDPSTVPGESPGRAMVSPRLAARLHVSASVEVYASVGLGHHANDSRAAAKVGGPGALASAHGAQLGARLVPTPGFTASADVWVLSPANGSAGSERPARCYGIDAKASWAATRWLSLDAGVATVADDGHAAAPGVIAGVGIAYHRGGETSIALRSRLIRQRQAGAERDLILDLVADHALANGLEVGLTVANLLDRGGPDDVHVTPGMPLTAMLELGLSY